MVKRKTYNKTKTKNRNTKRQTRKQYGGGYIKYEILEFPRVSTLSEFRTKIFDTLSQLLYYYKNNIIIAFPKNVYVIENDLIYQTSNLSVEDNNIKMELTEEQIDNIIKTYEKNKYPDINLINTNFVDSPTGKDTYVFLEGNPVVIMGHNSELGSNYQFDDFTDSENNHWSNQVQRPSRLDQFIYLSTTYDKIKHLLKLPNTELYNRKILVKPSLPSVNEYPVGYKPSSPKQPSFLQKIVDLVTPKSKFELAEKKRIKQKPNPDNRDTNTRKIYPVSPNPIYSPGNNTRSKKPSQNKSGS